MDIVLPHSALELAEWPWERIEPAVSALENQPLAAEGLDDWLAEWSRLWSLFDEAYWRLYIATTVDTSDAGAQRRYNQFLDGINLKFKEANQRLKEKLARSGLQPAGFDIPLRNLRAQAELFRAENLPLLNEHFKLAAEYERIAGAQTVLWEGEERTISQLEPLYLEPERAVREAAWRLGAERQLADRQPINDLWVRALAVRRRLAANVGLPDYRSYRWRELLRFDYTPDDCRRFHQAIEEVVVPAAERMYERRRRQLGVERLRPWDVHVDANSRPPLRPFQDVAELEARTSSIFHRVDPQLGAYFDTMRRESLLDLDNRKGKAPGGYCTELAHARLPFIFANSVGVHDDVQTLLHEGGHAFHVFEVAKLPYFHQHEVPLDSPR